MTASTKPQELRCFNPKCRSDQIVVGYDGQPARYLYGRCSECGCQGPRAAYDSQMTNVDLSMFSVPSDQVVMPKVEVEGVRVTDERVERAIAAFMEATRQAQLDDKYGERLICGKEAMRAALTAALGKGDAFDKCGTCGNEIHDGETHRYSSGVLTCWKCIKKSILPPPTTISEEGTR